MSERAGHGNPQPILVAGLHSVGKSTLAVHLAAALDGHVIEMGDIVRNEAAKRGSRNLVRLAERLLANDPLFIARVAAAVAHLGPQPAIIVGPRTPFEMSYLREQFPDALVVAIQAPVELRESRWRERQVSFTDTWTEREWQESAWGTARLVTSADLILNASEDLDSKVHSVIARRTPQYS